MHDVITKTLPANLAVLAVQREAAADIEAKAAQRQDSAMIERDLSRGAQPQAPAAEDDDLAAVLDAIEDLAQFAAEDALACGSGYPNGVPRDPDYAGMQRVEGKLLKAIDDVLAKRLAKALPAPDCVGTDLSGSPTAGTGLYAIHNPDTRGVL